MNLYITSLFIGVLILTSIVAIHIYVHLQRTKNVRRLYEAGLKRYKMLIKLDEKKLHKKK